MICSLAGTLTLIVGWVDKAFAQISEAEEMVARFEAARYWLAKR